MMPVITSILIGLAMLVTVSMLVKRGPRDRSEDDEWNDWG
jgi:multisubunit Na+/H+ antiporter MnhC subunit